MKVYVHENGMVLVGKGWEIVQKLKEYNKRYTLVSDLVQNISSK